MFYFQIKKINIENGLKCLAIFKSNNLIGLLVLISLIGSKI
jgi:4-hydroxybenzoate polyprenyltransferase